MNSQGISKSDIAHQVTYPPTRAILYVEQQNENRLTQRFDEGVFFRVLKITTFKLLSLIESNFKFHIIPYPTFLCDHNMGVVHSIGNGSGTKSTCTIGSVVGDITHRAIPQITFFHCLIINWNCCTCENIILEGVGAAKKRDGPVND